MGTVHASKINTKFSHGEWIERFESECLRLRPNLRGRINRSTAEYYYCQGYLPVDAARLWCIPSTAVGG